MGKLSQSLMSSWFSFHYKYVTPSFCSEALLTWSLSSERNIWGNVSPEVISVRQWSISTQIHILFYFRKAFLNCYKLQLSPIVPPSPPPGSPIISTLDLCSMTLFSGSFPLLSFLFSWFLSFLSFLHFQQCSNYCPLRALNNFPVFQRLFCIFPLFLSLLSSCFVSSIGHPLPVSLFWAANSQWVFLFTYAIAYYISFVFST